MEDAGRLRRCQPMRLVFLLFLSLLLAMPACAAVAQSKPNIIVCIADDISYDDFGCNGSKSARTPRIDQLAGKGM